MATTKPQAFVLPAEGFRLTDARGMADSIVYNNGMQATYAIAAAGSTQATATALSSVLNQVETVSAGQGVALPNSSGKRNVPFQSVIVVNTTTTPLKVYGFNTSSDTINGVAGSTGVTITGGTAVIFNSVKAGAWYSVGMGATPLPSVLVGTFTATGATEVVVSNTNIGANSVVAFGLKTAAGTIAGAPYMSSVTAGTSFGVKAGASDTSVYNYYIIG